MDELIGLLREAGITILVDVRAFPSSKRHPQFAKSSLEMALSERGIRYRWEGKSLGGFRKPEINSLNVALNSEGLNGYADYMRSREFAAAISGVSELASKSKIAIMCAERDPLQCHRSLISDYLTVRGVKVSHIIETDVTQTHRPNTLVREIGENLVYDRLTQSQLDLS